MDNNIALINKKILKAKARTSLINRIKSSKYLYLLFLPAFILLLLFTYYPMYGVILAFKDFNYSKGIMGSPWTTMFGFQHFFDLITDFGFAKAFMNTIIISFGRLLFEFPVAIILALLINEVRSKKYKGIVQTIFTLPHFLSWVVVMGVFYNLLSDVGVINELMASMGFAKVHLLTQASTFRGLLYATENWKEAGWGTIIYLAAITGVNTELYEAAIVDGAKRLDLLKYITLPAIISVIGVMLILQISSMMNAGFDQIFNMYNAAVYDKADIIDTYIYRRTFVTGADFASSTAIGLFKSVINFALLISANFIVKKSTGKGIY
jgi:putative aldouronate transport system permease protein